ncbi:MAG: hypothetical protein ACKVP3_07960 [Hyphomicrobiaceae bacterium]
MTDMIVQAKISLNDSLAAKRIKRDHRVRLRHLYRDAVRRQVRQDAIHAVCVEIGAEEIGAEDAAEGRMTPLGRSNDVSIQIPLLLSDYEAMKAAAHRIGISTKQYCRHSVASYISSMTASATGDDLPAHEDCRDFAESPAA